MALAYPGPSTELSNVVARDAFLDALDNNNLRIKILEREPVSLDDALKLACRFEAFDKTSAQPAQELRHNRDREKFVKTVNSAESRPPQPQKAQHSDSDILRELQQGLRECCTQMTECRRELEVLKALSNSSHTRVANPPSGTGVRPSCGLEVGQVGDNPPASMPAGMSSTPRSGPRRKSDSACHGCGQEGH